MRRVRVRATGNPVPKENDPRQFIGMDPVTVTETPYIRRRINKGELEVILVG